MFEFEKFMKDLEKRNQSHANRQKVLHEEDEHNQTRELDKLYKENPQNVIVYHPDEEKNAQ